MDKPTRAELQQRPQAYNSKEILTRIMERILALSPDIEPIRWDIEDMILDALLEMATMTYDRAREPLEQTCKAMASAQESHMEVRGCSDPHFDRTMQQFLDYVPKHREPKWAGALSIRIARQREKRNR